MTPQVFDHERLDVYRLSIDYVSRSFAVSQSLSGLHRHARDQWLRAAQSIPLNIAEGNGKRSRKDRARFLDIARGSALECAAIQDVLVTTKGIKIQDDAAMKTMLHRLVAMLTRMAMKFDGVGEGGVGYRKNGGAGNGEEGGAGNGEEGGAGSGSGVDYDYEHRFAEHEHGEKRGEERGEERGDLEAHEDESGSGEEGGAGSGSGVDYDYEHRFAEHEHGGKRGE